MFGLSSIGFSTRLDGIVCFWLIFPKPMIDICFLRSDRPCW